VLVDESHNFRNPRSQRYLNLDRLINLNGGRGGQGGRKKLILLTATPINNDLMDLYHQLNLVTRGDRSYFAAAGIGDLQRYFHAARRASRQGDGAVALFNLLEEVVIRRTRAFIKRAYPDATIAGKRIAFPERKLQTETYDLEATYEGIYEDIVERIEGLNLAPYNLESYKKKGARLDDFERGREQALVGIFKSRYLKRLESSVEAFRISVRRALEFQKTFLSYLLDGKLLGSTDFQKILRYLEKEDEEDDATPGSRLEDIEASDEARALLAELATVNPTDYDLKRLHEAVQKDVDSLAEIWHQIREIGPRQDAKLALLRDTRRVCQGTTRSPFCGRYAAVVSRLPLRTTTALAKTGARPKPLGILAESWMWKWRCGSLELPLLPAKPMGSPAFTLAPGLTLSEPGMRCA
jgi:SNF2 family DNA or RNA helicase